MKKAISLCLGTAGLALALMSSSAMAADKLTLQLKWVTQGQFAGYYVAKDKGFYEAENLDVEIKPGGPDVAPPQVIAGGGADVVVDWMPSALATREKGVALVNIAQPFKKSGMMLTCRKDTNITKPEDFKGRTLGVWFGGNEYPFLSWMSHLKIPTEGGKDGVTVLKQGFNVDPLIQKQADCISTMTYNEYWQVIDAGIPADQLVVFPYEEQGVATLEDGLYVLDKSLDDPAMVDKLARFVRASMKGWQYASENPAEAAEIILDNDASGAQTQEVQERMIKEIGKLIDGSDGTLDVAAADRTVDTLLGGGSDPVITKKPEGAWTSKITDAMKK
ncbi:ABC transporter substrate-binding protein [Brucella pituitosa]|uniref:Thiamine pyrimidine synthase n=1 Tax=Brucella pituitosa TaxID=571256 RepID=A0ABS3JYG5_9HYPH|nr:MULTISPECIES: ABC transporter substrate-binding protein [Brucella]PQZ49277.1 nitrate ABC transporter substrate-binding protein [Ochrobactrum sp. MYb19]PRA57504.1 nitrate ABC transporter substrate-binding protein [Ochrobactrum sp. MYb68]PRA66905.1 nitrate ABC transporter substrate-binding protein [Ochrobactrum sp. MYb18]PRA76065.1 nitrate ABC transporter substrate-binding protein [Brucella thiophenivorans]PRA89083.1 nitrate ABC transporter substrate-binding protein [Ochrobactrum sp. MYb29]P